MRFPLLFITFFLMLSSFSLQSMQNLDVNGDGKADILWRNQSNGENWLWTMDGVAVNNSQSLSTIALDWVIVGRGDFDGDGKSDILWRNSITGRNYIHLMDGFTILQAKELNTISDKNWKVKGVSDLNGDSKDDVIWHHKPTGKTWIYLLDGISVIASKGSKTVSDLNWEIVATGDLNSDGRGDILWRHSTTGNNFIWLMNGTEISSQYTLNTVGKSWNIVGVGDLNGDGSDDIIWRNASSGVNWAYLMNNGQIESSKQINTIADLSWQVRTIGDLNSDGKADIFWRHQETGKTYGYLMQGHKVETADYSSVISLNWQIISESTVPVEDNTNIVIPEPNSPPEALAGLDQQVTVGETVTLVGEGKDADNNIVSYRWEQLSGSETIDLVNEPTVSFTAPDVNASSEDYIFKLIVTDNDGLFGESTVKITINSTQNDNIAPVANAGTGRQVHFGYSTTLSGSGTDADGTIVSYLWEQTSGAEHVTLSDASTAITTFIAPSITSSSDFTFILTVTDDKGATSQDAVTIRVNGLDIGNIFPTAEAGSDQTVVEGDSVTLDGSASLDIDGHIAVYAWQQTSGSKVIELTNTATLSFVAPEPSASSESYAFQLQVIDDIGNTHTDSVNVIINLDPSNNLSPVANAGEDQIVENGDVINLNGSGTDSDGVIVSYHWRVIHPNPLIGEFDIADTANTTFDPQDYVGTYGFRLTVTDNSGDTDSDLVYVTVNPVGHVNSLPVVNAGEDQSNWGNSTVVLSGVATDEDGTVDIYTWAQVSGPRTISLSNADTISASFTAPDVSESESYTFSLTVWDNDGGSSSDSINITINPEEDEIPNVLPVANAGGNQTVESGGTVSLNGSGTDSDGTIVSYRWVVTDANPAIGDWDLAYTENTTFTPYLSDVTYGVRLIVTDNSGDTASDQIYITVNTANKLPVVNAGADQSSSGNSGVQLSGQASDEDGTVDVYAWSQVSGPRTISLSNADTISASFTAPDVSENESYTFSLTVWDNDGGSSTDSITITVTPEVVETPNVPPVANAGGNQTIENGTTASLNGSGTDSDGTIVSYSWWELHPNPVIGWMQISTSATASFSPPHTEEAITYSLKLIVTDNSGETGSDSISITVNP